MVNAVHRADPRELLVSTPSAEDVKRVADEVVAADARARRPLRVTVDAAEGATFPYAWYFRHLASVEYPDLSVSGDVRGADVAILTQGSRTRLRPQLAGFDERRFRFRVWWVRGAKLSDYKAMTPSAARAWPPRREPWTPTGGMPESLERRRPAGD